MEKLFLEVLNRSLTASILIVAVLLVRIILKKAPKWISCLLWGIVAVRLICPLTIESAMSILPTAKPVPSDIATMSQPQINTGVSVINQAVNPVLIESFAPEPTNSVNPLQIWELLATYIWIVGMVVLIAYAVISYIRLYRKVRGSVSIEEHVKINDYIETPFILGVIRPMIYLPSAISDGQMQHVVAHEKVHIKRRDYLWKPIGFLILVMHWFNPLVWLSYILLCKDIEIACDEGVISNMDKTDAIAYSQTLLECSNLESRVKRRNILVCPIAFGEVSVKERIKHVLHYKKPAFWIGFAAIVICIVVAVCFLTNPKEKLPEESGNGGALSSEMLSSDAMPGEVVSSEMAGDSELAEGGETAASTEITANHDGEGMSIQQAIMEHCAANCGNAGPYQAASFIKLGQEIIDNTETEQTYTVYGTMLYMEASVDETGILDEAGEAGPVALTYTHNLTDDTYELLEYWTPGDGSNYVKDIKEKFPKNFVEDAVDTQKYIYLKTMDCYDQIIQASDLNTNAVIGRYLDLLVNKVGQSMPENFSDDELLYRRELVYYGAYTLAYHEKMKNDFDGVRKELLDSICDEITGYMASNATEPVINEATDNILDYLASLPDDAVELANSGCFAITYHSLYGMQHFKDFMTSYEAKIPAQLVIGQFTTEGDLVLFFLQYDGNEIMLMHDSRRDQFGGNGERIFTYHYQSLEYMESVEANGDITGTILLKDALDIQESDEQGEIAKQYMLATFYNGNTHAVVNKELAHHDMATLFDETTVLVDKEKVYSMTVVNALTGESKEYSVLDSNDGFIRIMDAIYNLDIAPGSEDAYRGGKQYVIYLCDVDKNVLQIIVPYQDATVIDYQFYEGTANGTSNQLLTIVDEVFQS